MKAGWQVRPLAEMADCCLGKMLDKQKNRGEPQPYLRNVNVRWFEFDLSVLLEMPFEANEQERYGIRKGDLVICEGGYPGRCAIWENDEPVFFQKALHRVRCHEPERAKWIQYFLWMSDADGSLRSHFTGSGIQHLTGQALARLRIPFPPLEEQRRIVAVLDEAFAAIATAAANAEKNLANTRELLACTIERILEGASDYRTMPLQAAADESCSLSYGIVQPGDEQVGGLPIVRPTDLRQKYIELGPLKRIAPDLASGYQRTKLRGDELLLCVRGTTGTLSIATPELAGGNVTRGIVPIRFNPTILSQELGYYLLSSASIQNEIKAATYGTALMQINIRDLKQLELRVPKLASQDALADRLDAAQRHTEELQANYSAQLNALTALKQSILHRAFSGELTPKAAAAVALNDNFATPDFAAKVVAFAYERHVAKNRIRNFGTVKAEKILHMVEAVGGIDLGRHPLREAAGPDDAKHRHATWDWARSQRFFRFNKRSSGGHDFEKLPLYPAMIEDARTAIAGTPVEKAIELLVDMDRDFAELIATTYAAWNNLIIDQCAATDRDIVLAARDKWHRDKLRFDPSRFHDAIRFIRSNGIVPEGTAKRVGGQEALLF